MNNKRKVREFLSYTEKYLSNAELLEVKELK